MPRSPSSTSGSLTQRIGFGRWETSANEADARLRAAEQHAAAGRRAEASAELDRALAFYRSVGATRYIRQGEALLAASA